VTRIDWDQITDRTFETGIDRAVLYTAERPAAAWNGLTAVTETGSPETKEYFYEGLKVLVRVIPGAYSGKIEAVTYPDVLDEITGTLSHSAGIRVHYARAEPFHLTYRTRIGNPIDGTDHGYKIHLVYNLLASFDDIAAKTIGETTEATPFSWSVSGMQKFVVDGRPADHISIDSRLVDPEWLANLENDLYGTDLTAPFIPLPSSVLLV